jgi:hypothetical protein
VQIKSKKRVVDHGEVFTAEREVGAMLDLVKQETCRIDSRFLEPACGTGNFLIEVLRRKLNAVEDTYKKSQTDYERYAIIAIASLYGVDILPDNVIHCRDRLYDYFVQRYTALYGQECLPPCLRAARFIIDQNILCGDALTMQGADDTPLIFSEWTPVNGSLIKRRAYSLAHLLVYQPMQGPNLFSDMGEAAFIPKPVQDYPLTHFLKLGEPQE